MLMCSKKHFLQSQESETHFEFTGLLSYIYEYKSL